MSDFLSTPTAAGIAVAACGLGLLLLVYLLLSPGPERLSLERRRPGAAPSTGPLTGATASATATIEKVLIRRGGGTGTALERAGLKTRPQDFVLLVIVGSVVAALIGMLLGGPLLGLLFALVSPLLAKLAVGMLADRRQDAFADQLDDSLQLMASSLRAGHSLLQALDSVSREAEQPTSEEFARIINETRVGRDLGSALDETAERMGSEDFVWVAQAIAINREVGGNLADVLDGVGHTIRERNQIRRQVKALSAEGKLSAYVLMALPVGIVAFLTLFSREYVVTFTESLFGFALIGLAVVLMLVGAIWLRKVVNIKF